MHFPSQLALKLATYATSTSTAYVSVWVWVWLCVSVCVCVLGLMHADFIWLPDKPNEIRVQSADDCYFCCKANKIWTTCVCVEGEGDKG